jgi:hypothetical protein
VSAKQKLSPPPLRGRLFLFLLWGFLHLCSPVATRADSLEDAARALARRVATSLHGASVTCEERNLSTLQESESLHFVAAFRDELQRRGVKIVEREEGVTIALTLSESVEGYVGIVRIQKGENSDVMMQQMARRTASVGSQSAETMSLHKELMLAQDAPLVDANVHNYGPIYLDTLSEQQIDSYEWKENKWELVYSKVLQRKRIVARDLRGIVGRSVDAMAALFPGEACRSGQSWKCEPDAFRLLRGAVDRELVASKKSPPGLSAAQFEMNGQDALVIAGEEGLARLYLHESEPLVTIPGWGSDIASTRSGCGNGWQLLITGKGDWGSPDVVTGLQIEGGKVTKATESIDFPGPVISMHETQSDKNADRNMAIAVVHNLQSGLYEVYRLTISCPN